MRAYRRLSALVLAAVLMLMCGCGARSTPAASPVPAEQTASPAPAEQTASPAPAEPPAERVDDAFREWYEVFVWSFADSDGDGIGDLAGLTDRLDYIRDLGCNGIWLMPVMPSPSYHKYDVVDYYDIDPQYGSLEDMRGLLSEAHERDIRVIIDLPVNHTSDRHPWFLSAAEGSDAAYRDYYNWSTEAKSGYSPINGSWYESRFVSSMPDLNLDNPAVRREIESILRFWLEDVGVDGFRLDAVTSYHTGQIADNVEFLNWLADTAHEIAPGCFLVAEAWENLNTIALYAESRTDSFFLFPASQSSGYIARVLNKTNDAPGSTLAGYLEEIEATLPVDTIPAPFLENHDTGRTVGFTGRKDPVKTKMAAGLLALMRGGIFIYYGQEIGMVGSGEDPNKRIGMLWTAQDETTAPPPGTTKIEYAYPSVSEQTEDPASLLNYYRAALALRARFPEISRGRTTVLPCEDGRACLALRTWEGSSVLLAVNPSRETVTVILPEEAADHSVLADSLLADEGEIILADRTLTMPPCSIAVLKTA